MAGDRGRDLKVSIISDAAGFTAEQPARELDQLARNADDATRKLGDLERQGGDTGRKVSNAFEDIARAARTNTRKLDDDVDRAGKGLDDFKDEAAGAGREAAQSFSGEFDDISDLVQEVAAQAFGGFGPLGAAAGVAAAVGIGVITKAFGDAKTRAEESKQRVTEFFDAFVEGSGRLSAETITARMQDMLGDPEQYQQLRKDAGEARVSVELLARARAGDLEAVKRVAEQIRAHNEVLNANQHITTDLESAQLAQRNALDRVSDSLGIARQEVNDANTAWGIFDRATRAGIVAPVEVDAPTDAELRAEHRAMRDQLGRPVSVPVRPALSTADAAEARRQLSAFFVRNPVTVNVTPRPGQGQGYGVVVRRP